MLYDCVKHIEKNSVMTALQWNKDHQDDTENHKFNVNVPNNRENDWTPLHMACSFPSLSLIMDIIADKHLNPIVFEFCLKLPSQLVPLNYLSSKKVVIKREFDRFLLILNIPLNKDIQSDEIEADEHYKPLNGIGFNKSEGASSIASDIDCAQSYGPASCSNYASDKKKKFIMDLGPKKPENQDSKCLFYIPKSKFTTSVSSNNSISIKPTKKIGLFKLGGIYSENPRDAETKGKYNIQSGKPNPFFIPKPHPVEVSFEEFYGNMNKLELKEKKPRFSIKTPKSFKTNLGSPMVSRYGPDPSGYSDVSEIRTGENSLDKEKNSIPRCMLANLIATSRKKSPDLNYGKPTSMNSIKIIPGIKKSDNSAAKNDRHFALVKPSQSIVKSIEKLMDKLANLSRNIYVKSNTGLLSTSFKPEYIRNLTKIRTEVKYLMMILDKNQDTWAQNEKEIVKKCSKYLEFCLDSTKSTIIICSNSSRWAELNVIKAHFFELAEITSIIQSFHQMINHQVSDLFSRIKKIINKNELQGIKKSKEI